MREIRLPKTNESNYNEDDKNDFCKLYEENAEEDICI